MNKLKAFKVKVRDKTLDYRKGKSLDLKKISNFFSKKGYQVKNLESASRHVVGQLLKNRQNLFLKISTTPGISVLTQIEAKWNQQFNSQVKRQASPFWVPQNYDQGFYKKDLFYLITDYFEGPLLGLPKYQKNNLNQVKKHLNQIIDFSELIQNLNIKKIKSREYIQANTPQEWQTKKTKTWLNSIPKKVAEKYQLKKVFEAVKTGMKNLHPAPRHGDFTPWHLIKLKNNRLGLIDGEHALSDGVKYYDIAYFIQRVYSVMQAPKTAKQFLKELEKREYNFKKLKILLLSRAIGGFLDESLKPSPNYPLAQKFLNFTTLVS